MDHFLDILFLVFHTALVGFNLLGWIWRSTRRLHLAIIGLTLLSWFGLGIFYGWGYCPCTDWHWQVKRRLGESDLPASYVTYYLNLLTGISWKPDLVDGLVLLFGLTAFLCSLILNLRDRKRARDARQQR